MGCKYGIDFGTTNTSVSIRYLDSAANQAVTHCFLMRGVGSLLECLPSVVAFDSRGPLIVGQAAKEEKINRGDRVTFVSGIKPQLLKDASADENSEYVKYATAILRKVRETAEDQRILLPVEEIEGVVIGVPVGCGDSYKRLLRRILVQAGYYQDENEAKRKTEFVSEPIAVALHYGTKAQQAQTVFVFDFGGGTLDFTLMDISRVGDRMELEQDDVLSKGGLALGGDYLTKQFFIKVFLPKYGREQFEDDFEIPCYYSLDEIWDALLKTEAGYKLLEELEKCKMALSISRSWRVTLQNPYVDLEFNREEFEAAIEGELDRILGAVNKCLQESRVRPFRAEDVDVVLMAGGSSMIPAVQKLLIKRFGRKVKIAEQGEMITSIARGLATAGYNSTGRPRFRDIADCAYGVWDDATDQVEIIIPANTLIEETRIDRFTRAGKFQSFRTLDSMPTFIRLKIYEVPAEGSPRFLGNIECRLNGQNKFDVFLSLDDSNESGVLSVDVFDKIRRKFMDEIPQNQRLFEIDSTIS